MSHTKSNKGSNRPPKSETNFHDVSGPRGLRPMMPSLSFQTTDPINQDLSFIWKVPFSKEAFRAR